MGAIERNVGGIFLSLAPERAGRVGYYSFCCYALVGAEVVMNGEPSEDFAFLRGKGSSYLNVAFTNNSPEVHSLVACLNLEAFTRIKSHESSILLLGEG
jgi:hypothetical protein